MKMLIIAFRNLSRMKKRTFLTASLIAIGVLFVLLFNAFSGSFKNYMIAQITDSALGHYQVHRKGYIASLDNMPLDKNLTPQAVTAILEAAKASGELEASSARLKVGAMLSNFESTTSVRLNGIIPQDELATLPMLRERIEGNIEFSEGEIIIPEVVANGMKLKVGDTIVLIATNLDGSVNAVTLSIAGVVSMVTGPGGRDGYIHIEDARRLLRIADGEVNEVIFRLKNTDALDSEMVAMESFIASKINPQGQPSFELHDWRKLSPFFNIVRMIDIMNIGIKFILVSIILVSILNVMIMSVYERTKEIGTMSAIGTPASFILGMFVTEGVLLGVYGFFAGLITTALALIAIGDLPFAFGRESNLVLSPTLSAIDILPIALVVLIVAAVASFFPAFKASRLNPVDALRS